MIIYAGFKGYQKYKKKKAAAAAAESKSKDDRVSISPSIDSTSTGSSPVVGGRPISIIDDADSQLPAYERIPPSMKSETYRYSAPYSPDTVGAPAKAMIQPEPAAVELCGDYPSEPAYSNIMELPGDSSFGPQSGVFELAGDNYSISMADDVDDPTTPLSPAPAPSSAPVHVVNRESLFKAEVPRQSESQSGSSPLSPAVVETVPKPMPKSTACLYDGHEYDDESGDEYDDAPQPQLQLQSQSQREWQRKSVLPKSTEESQFRLTLPMNMLRNENTGTSSGLPNNRPRSC